MKKYLLSLAVLGLLLAATSCKKDEPETWLVPSEEIFDGGPGKDGIRSLDNPLFDLASETEYLKDDDLVLGIKVGDEIRAYPHPVIDWHEIVNDEIGSLGVAITYCPLTGTGIGWNRDVGGVRTTFGVSGLLYNSNLIPYDRNTDSNWSQMRLECINGDLSGSTPSLIPIVETSWAVWKKWYPDSKVMNIKTGFDRRYGVYPYGPYKTNEDLLFSVTPDDTRLPRKERVLGVLNGPNKAYRFSSFDYQESGIGIIHDVVGTQAIIVVASEEDDFITAFKDNGKIFTTLASEEGSAILEDEDGNQYNIFGEVIDNSNMAINLESMPSFIGYWFSWGAFYPGIEIY